jgi:hypothetical protein
MVQLCYKFIFVVVSCPDYDLNSMLGGRSFLSGNYGCSTNHKKPQLVNNKYTSVIKLHCACGYNLLKCACAILTPYKLYVERFQLGTRQDTFLQYFHRDHIIIIFSNYKDLGWHQ